ncbi:MAG: cell filamentation protein Fic [Sphingobacteriia bacterium 35-40-5]|nr:MAG: cell filamentation protein Fic [Sphingobacteriia bacterium 35-40-5]
MARNTSSTKEEILEFIKDHPACSSTEILQGLGLNRSIATLKRTLQEFVKEDLVVAIGVLKSRKYSISPAYHILRPIDLEHYFQQEIDQRVILENFNHDLLRNALKQIPLFTNDQLLALGQLQDKFRENSSKLSAGEFKTEMERLAIDLSWKSSQIEGNTYSLLETERLLKYKETAAGKTKDEATMLVNHKSALDFIIDHPDYIHPLSVSCIEDIHSILIKELDITRNIRNRRVGISGTNYKPLDNEFQIKEALTDMCQLINEKENVFEKALLALVLISYIQPFSDGNKRTARIISNAILMHNHYCPISFRTIDSVEYKKAMLVFYEQTNIQPFKKVFIDQFEFAVNTYF